MSPSQHSPARYVAMKDSWSHGDDRRDRGRVDRGVTRQRRSPSPLPRRLETEREPRERDRGSAKGRPFEARDERPRERSRDRRRRTSRSPVRDTREEVRERNRGRELLEPRGAEKPRRSYTSPSSNKRRKSRSPSPIRSHHKKSRRDSSRSPSGIGGGSSSSRPEKKRRTLSPHPPRKRSPDRRLSDNRVEAKSKYHRDPKPSERRSRSRSPKHDRHNRDELTRRGPQVSTSNRRHSPTHHHRQQHERPLSGHPGTRERRQESSLSATGLRLPGSDHNESKRSRAQSPSAARSANLPRGSSPKSERAGRLHRDDLRSAKFKPKGATLSQPTASGANSIEINGGKRTSISKSGGSSANGTEAKSDKMDGRGYYVGQQGYNPNQQMQAAFPLKPQYNQAAQPEARQYSQSPQHQMTPNSYHGSPQAQSPYSAGRGNWGPQQQYSPQAQYPPQYHQHSSYSAPSGPQGTYYNGQSQSPPYQAPTGPMNQSYPQSNFRGAQRGFRGNQFNHRGGRGSGHFQNLHWNSTSGTSGAGRGQHSSSGNVTPQHASPQPQFPSRAGSQEGHTKYSEPPPQEDEDVEDLFRPSKELQVEDKEVVKKQDEVQMPPPSRPVPTGPQSQQNASKFSFAFKASSKATPTAPKPEISQKLSATPVRRDVQTSPEKPRGPSGPMNIPTEPASARRPEFRETLPTTRKVKKTLKRQKPRPQLEDDFKKSDSVYYRKPGNESVVGAGTYGKVFKAVHVYTKSLVALKKIRMEGERDGFPVTAVREIKLLQSLKHPNIVNLQEVMVEKNDCFMVFEYLSHDLTGLLNHPTFKLEEAHKKHLAKQLFEGLDYLHRRGVLHRDIKAANILVSSDGQLKLADFGLARFFAKRRQLDYTNRVITIWYRSPELLLGETQYGPAVDIWSAACVLVEIFTRHAIFPGDGSEISQLEKIYAILGTPNKVDWPGLVDMAWFELLRPSARRANVFADKYKERVTPAAFELLEAMFQYDPVKRPSASDVLEHPYFTVEEPVPRQAVELAAIEGEWHEFESKALRKENERKDKETRKQAQKDAAAKAEKDKKRGVEGESTEREAKRIAMGPPSIPISQMQQPT